MPVPNVRSLLLVNCNLKCIQPTVITYGVTVHVCCFISSDAVIAESVEFFMGDNLPHLGAGDVVDEVVALLAKLECERCEVLDALQRERQRSEVLKVRINEFCKKRLVDLPKAVQAGQCCVLDYLFRVSIVQFFYRSTRSALAPEHESCASDLSELNWHVDFNTKKYDIILQLVNKAEAQNRKLKEDIEFINGHVLVHV